MTKSIPLTQGKFTLVDDVDYDSLIRHKWLFISCRYAGRMSVLPTGKRVAIYMHMEILGDCDGREIDHINGDKLDNRRSNLRFCTRSQNSMNHVLQSNNTSGYKGVWLRATTHHWQAEIMINQKHIRLGAFLSAEDAARAYDRAARKYFGEFAKLNFPD